MLFSNFSFSDKKSKGFIFHEENMGERFILLLKVGKEEYISGRVLYVF